MTVSRTAPELEAVALTKRFGAFTALDDVTMKVRSGSLHALLGENGAGKSTLVKCLMGFHQPDAGNVLIDGREVRVDSPRDAQSFGIGMVYQHFTLVPSLTGLENLAVSRNGGGQLLDWAEETRLIDAARERLPFDLPLHRRVADLSSGEKQKLEILKQLYLGTRFLILDEPTSVLTPAEADEVLTTLHGLTRKAGVTLLMISHKFREVMTYSDAVTVLRKGALVGHCATRETTQDELGQMMIGRSFDGSSTIRKTQSRSRTVLELRNFRLPATGVATGLRVDELTLASGEIYGIAGVAGNGQRELFECLAGQRSKWQGRMELDGERFAPDRQGLRDQGIRFLPEEPLHNAMAGKMSLWENLGISRFDRTRPGLARFFPDRAALRQAAARYVADYRIETRSLATPIRELSGGNVQRAALAREVSDDARLLIVSNPCFGLDFLSAHDVRQRLVAARNKGVSILLFSEDLDELLTLSDKIAVMSEGRLTPFGAKESIARNDIGAAMAGGCIDADV